MPADAWLLLIVSVGLGLGVELVYMRARRRDGHMGRRGDTRRRGRSGDERTREDRHP
ncbi:MAG: hypothetical protein HKO77_06160 [Gemmatimonadetes bacterium]|nr:hypothetical protein [Gemmatimonadota bacterium]NNL30584.1 hypothetical protein [Gemmatimonadota bacterium]